VFTEDGVKESWVDNTGKVIEKIGKEELNQLQNKIDNL
jgi:hypothetical protein